MNSYYDTMQVCKKMGHKITDCYDNYPQHRQDHCDKCGSETVIVCEFCGAKIRGHYHVSGLIVCGEKTEVSLYCHKCGKPYPWKNVLLIKNTIKILVLPAKYIIDSVIRIFKK